MRPTHAVAPEDSLHRAASELRRNGGDLIPLAFDGVLEGVVTETSLARALAEGIDLNSAASLAALPAATIPPYATGAEALRRLAEEEMPCLVVVDDQNRVLGLVSATDLVPRRRVVPRPAMVGGMATPFGVYLTNGVVTGGAGGFALVCTGALMFTLLFGAECLVTYAMPALLSLGVPSSWGELVRSTLAPVLFLFAMRMVPLAGTHAAEHQVVHALERGEDLVPEVVKRMPRVHPRCGTNLAAGATIFLSIFATEWIPYKEVRLMVAFFATMLLWRRIGSLLQEFVTTRPANEKQLRSGIQAAQQLLDHYARSRVATPSIPQRLWNSGILQVMIGSALMAGLIALLAWQFNLPVEL
jgi:CBS domain-containing protein